MKKKIRRPAALASAVVIGAGVGISLVGTVECDSPACREAIRAILEERGPRSAAGPYQGVISFGIGANTSASATFVSSAEELQALGLPGLYYG